MIDNALLLAFVNETIRPVGDRLAGLLPIPKAVLDALQGQGLAAVLGTSDAALRREQGWEQADYDAVPLQAIAGSDAGGRALLTNHHVIAVIRALAAVKNLDDDNPALRIVLGAVAVNPRG